MSRVVWGVTVIVLAGVPMIAGDYYINFTSQIFIAAIFFVPPALLLPLLEPLDRRQNFTLGYICSARKPASAS